jgi:hypothetical protein
MSNAVRESKVGALCHAGKNTQQAPKLFKHASKTTQLDRCLGRSGNSLAYCLCISSLMCRNVRGAFATGATGSRARCGLTAIKGDECRDSSQEGGQADAQAAARRGPAVVVGGLAGAADVVA